MEGRAATPPDRPRPGAGRRDRKQPGLVADLLVCENRIGVLPPRFRLAWLLLALALVVLLGVVGHVLRSEPGANPPRATAGNR